MADETSNRVRIYEAWVLRFDEEVAVIKVVNLPEHERLLEGERLIPVGLVEAIDRKREGAPITLRVEEAANTLTLRVEPREVNDDERPPWADGWDALVERTRHITPAKLEG